MFYEKQFKKWMLNHINSKNPEETCPHYISDARAVERDYSVSIDAEFLHDACQHLLNSIDKNENHTEGRKKRHNYVVRLYVTFREAFNDLNTESIVQSKSRNTYPPLNRIFYGPPGTGKTYHTIKAAIEILAPELSESSREEQKARFDAFLSEGKIRFVTFHQSFSYEDFVEGIRPNITEEDNENKNNIAYTIYSGIFKEICEAAKARPVTPVITDIDLTDRKIWKMSLGDSYKDKATYEYCLRNDIILMGYGWGYDFTNATSREDIHQIIKEEGANDTITGMVYNFTQKMQKGDIIVIPEGLTKIRAIAEVTGDYAYFTDEVLNHKGHAYRQSRAVRWLCQFSPPMPVTSLQEKQFSQLTLYSLSLNEKEIHNLQTIIAPPKNDIPDKYVLIIDEINRGNISGIFGELITLIEPSKRLGAEEELKVTLPYSRESFGVPDNLYIIGTMNTADRSLTGLDIALRRRFTFVEMPPDYSLLEDKQIENTDIDLSQILQVMNARIEVLLGRDYCLGHAPFMHLGSRITVDELELIFRNTIIPLLQEYFFEDWRKIHLVLNDNKKDVACRFITQKTIPADIFDEEELAQFPRELWEINENAFYETESYMGIVDPSTVAKVNLTGDVWKNIPPTVDSTSSKFIGDDGSEINDITRICTWDKYQLVGSKTENGTETFTVFINGEKQSVAKYAIEVLTLDANLPAVPRKRITHSHARNVFKYAIAYLQS